MYPKAGAFYFQVALALDLDPVWPIQLFDFAVSSTVYGTPSRLSAGQACWVIPAFVGVPILLV